MQNKKLQKTMQPRTPPEKKPAPVNVQPVVVEQPKQQSEEEIAKIKAACIKKREEIQEKFKIFHQDVLQNKTLDLNKTASEKIKEQSIIENLLQSAIELDAINVNEGMLVLFTVLFREILGLRDRLNETEYSLLKTAKELLTLKKDLGN